MAAAIKQLKNPPITEAIFAISFKEALSQEKLLLFSETDYVKSNYPTNNPSLVVEFSQKEKQDPKISHKSEGYLLKGKKGFDRAIQVMPTMLSYHNFNKYAGWDELYKELKEVWAIFFTTVARTRISQLSVRYLNQIPIDLPMESGFAEYIQLLPQVPGGIRSDINNFFIQINVPNEDNDLEGIVTETIIDQSKEKIKVLIDLSVVKKGDFECDSREIWDSFTKIRDFKDTLFFNCITEKTEQKFI